MKNGYFYEFLHFLRKITNFVKKAIFPVGFGPRGSKIGQKRRNFDDFLSILRKGEKRGFFCQKNQKLNMKNTEVRALLGKSKMGQK
jgi:hypothetical protein